MEDLSIYFSSYGDTSDCLPTQLGAKMTVHSAGQSTPPQEKSIAILFVPEYRYSEKEVPEHAVAAIRSKLYHLFPKDWSSSIADLGTIRPGHTLSDTYIAVEEVVRELVKNNVLPIVIGGGQDLMLPVYNAYQSLEQTVNVLDINCSLDIATTEEASPKWLNHLFTDPSGHLFNYTLMGYQEYLTDSEIIYLLSELHFDAHRLGEYYEDDRMAEPIIRNADILSFNMDAIRGSDYRGNSKALPHGFYGEDACRMLRYAGLSDKLTALGIFDFQVSDQLEFDANLIAQMLWYFIEGYNHRKQDYPAGSKSNYTRYVVPIDNFKNEIVFYKSDKSDRWWMEVPYPSKKENRFARHLLIPCQYADYENALANELPDLWWKTANKLS